MKYLKITLLILLIIPALAFVFQFIINSKYSFPQPVPFKGNNFFNPYLGIDSTKWIKANFHLHTKLLFGLTAGAPNSNAVADSFYNYFDYKVCGRSDYMRINTWGSNKQAYIPVYEHGYQYYKTHQLVIGAKKVRWIDYFFRQTPDNKQYVINTLKKDTSTLVTIVHPMYRNAYPFSDFTKLSNYDCFEIANSRYRFERYYDTILSGGHAVFLMADDDAHNLSNLMDGARSFNIINSGTEENSIINALKRGRSYAVSLGKGSLRTNSEKKEAIRRLPVLKEVRIDNDTLKVHMNQRVNAIRFYGQNGVLKDSSVNCNYGTYKLTKEDTYIRTEIICNDGSVCFLNPVFRYDGSPLNVAAPGINILKTWTYRIVFILVLFIIIFLRIKAMSRTSNKQYSFKVD